MVTIARVEVSAYRQPLAAPVATSFGMMRDRPAVFARIEDADGAHGWGEIFANRSASGAEHRCRLVAEDLSDLLIGHEIEAPRDLFAHLDARTRIRAPQCGEQEPSAQCIAGLETAARDLFARRAGVPLYRYVNRDAVGTVPVSRAGSTSMRPPSSSPRPGTGVRRGEGQGRFCGGGGACEDRPPARGRGCGHRADD